METGDELVFCSGCREENGVGIALGGERELGAHPHTHIDVVE